MLYIITFVDQLVFGEAIWVVVYYQNFDSLSQNG